MPRWKELKRFCDNDGWELYKDTDHFYYRKHYEDGTVKWTKVSKGSGEIHSHMCASYWKHNHNVLHMCMVCDILDILKRGDF